MARKRTQWRLPKTYKPRPIKDGHIIRNDGEPRFYELIKYGNDRTLHTDTFIQCCGCGLEHHHTFNIVTTLDGKWHLIHRAYSVPGTGRKKDADYRSS